MSNEPDHTQDHNPDLRIDPQDEPAANQPAPKAPRSPETLRAAREFAIRAARLASDLHCEHVLVLDVHDQSPVTDFVLIASGTSDRQMRSVMDDITELGGSLGFPAARTNADDRTLWLLADFVDVLVHLFEPGTRAHYDLEMLWGDADLVEWREGDSHSTDHAGLNRPSKLG